MAYPRGKTNSNPIKYNTTIPGGTVTYPLKWDQDAEHYYETGVEHAVLFLKKDQGAETGAPTFTGVASAGGTAPTISLTNHYYYGGVAWNGLISCTQSPEGADTEDLYADNDKYLTMRGVESFAGSLSAYTYPDKWEEADGISVPVAGMKVHGQTRQAFGLAYTTREGNDIDGDGFAYKMHLVYGATASPSDREYSTVNDSPEAIEFSWDFETTPISDNVNNVNMSTAYIEISSAEVSDNAWTNLCCAVFGDDTGASGYTECPAFLPTPSELYSLLNVQ